MIITDLWLEQLEKLDRKASDLVDMGSRTVAYHVRELLRKHPVSAHAKEMRVIKDIIRVLEQIGIRSEEFIGPLDLERY